MILLGLLLGLAVLGLLAHRWGTDSTERLTSEEERLVAFGVRWDHLEPRVPESAPVKTFFALKPTEDL